MNETQAVPSAAITRHDLPRRLLMMSSCLNEGDQILFSVLSKNPERYAAEIVQRQTQLAFAEFLAAQTAAPPPLPTRAGAAVDSPLHPTSTRDSSEPVPGDIASPPSATIPPASPLNPQSPTSAPAAAADPAVHPQHPLGLGIPPVENLLIEELEVQLSGFQPLLLDFKAGRLTLMLLGPAKAGSKIYPLRKISIELEKPTLIWLSQMLIDALTSRLKLLAQVFSTQEALRWVEAPATTPDSPIVEPSQGDAFAPLRV